jgi:RNA polymerase sigma-70 factor (sigma-E family)
MSVGEISDGDFAEFAARELGGLVRLAMMLTGDRELARDLVQDVMLKVQSRWSRVAAADSPERYVKTMVVNAHLSWRRRWSVRHMVVAYSEQMLDAPTPDHAASIVDHDDIWQRLATLPRQQRAVLVLRYYERLTDTEIAEVLGCAVGTVRGYASRALASLRLGLATEVDLAKEERR